MTCFRRFTAIAIVAPMLVIACSAPRRATTETAAMPANAARSAATAAKHAQTKLSAAATCNGVVPSTLPKHVFLIVLENEGYDNTFGSNAPDSTLTKLKQRGTLLTRYYGIGHNSLDNYIAMISGQAPNPLTQFDCPKFLDFIDLPETVRQLNDEQQEEVTNHAQLKRHHRRDLLQRLNRTPDKDRPEDDLDQVLGVGCVYPRTVETLAGQLEKRGLHWRAYMQGMSKRCEHPQLGTLDTTRNGPYAVRHNPFAYFHSLETSCAAHDVPLEPVDGTKGLARDLKDPTQPEFVFIVPDLCNDGHNDCDHTGRPGQLARINAFLDTWVPRIEGSDAFKKDGVLIITFDEADLATDVSPAAVKETVKKNKAASSYCCDEVPGPSAERPGLYGRGGGRIGAIVLSPFVERGKEISAPFNHYSLLRSIEDLFGLQHIGFAKQNGLKTFQECGVFKATPPANATADALSR